MSLLSLSALALCLLATITPVWLMRKEPRPRRQDDWASAQAMPAAVLGNAAIASGLRLAVLAPCFALGAGGDFWPVILGGVAFGLGVAALAACRRSVVAFVDRALEQDTSFTPTAFAAGRLRGLAAVVMSLALVALLVLEAKVALEVLTPAGLPLAVVALVALAGLAAFPAGNGGAIQAMQLQLGFLYLALFGAAVLVLYLAMAAVAPPTFGGSLAVAALAGGCLTIAVYRRNKYVEAKAIRTPESLPSGERRASRLLAGFVRLFNRLITTLAIVALVFAGMLLVFSGALQTLTGGPAAGSPELDREGLALIATVAFLAPILDPGNWQRLAALRKSRTAPEPERASAVRRAVLLYALETPFVCLLVALLGAVAAQTGWDAAGGLAGFGAYLLEQRHVIASTGLWFVLLVAAMAAVSSIIGTLQALACTIRYDLWPGRGAS